MLCGEYVVASLGTIGRGVGLGVWVRLGMYEALKSCVMLIRILFTKSLG